MVIFHGYVSLPEGNHYKPPLSVCHFRPKLSSLRDFEVLVVEASLNFQAQLELQELEEPGRCPMDKSVHLLEMDDIHDIHDID